jgi:DNA-binding NarL/FixJ family response regulator
VDDRLITAVLIDDHEVVAAGVRAWCASAVPPIDLVDSDVKVAAAWTGAGAAADVVILDLQLGQGKAFEALRQLVGSGRQVVVYTHYTDDATAVRCIQLGALAYVTKAEGKEHLVTAVRSAARGDAYTPPSLSGAMAADKHHERPKLTVREEEALRAWFASPTKGMAAMRLNVTPKTLDTYLQRARVRYANVGRPAKTKSDLVARALEDGLITLEDLQG